MIWGSTGRDGSDLVLRTIHNQGRVEKVRITFWLLEQTPLDLHSNGGQHRILGVQIQWLSSLR